MYFLFAYDHYYPAGGFGDYMGRFSSIQTALDYLNDMKVIHNQAHIVDVFQQEIVANFTNHDNTYEAVDWKQDPV